MFEIITYQSLDDLNAQAYTWCDTHAADRPCPEEREKTVRMVFSEEQPRLIALPDNPYPCDEVEEVRVPKTPYVRFDLNDYSVPPEHVRKTLTVNAALDTVTISDGAHVVATHTRSFDKGAQIEAQAHFDTLSAHKQKARLHRGQHRLTHAIDCARDFLKRAAERGYPLSSTTSQLIGLLDDYGAALLNDAMQDALTRGVAHPNAVRQSLQRLLDEREQMPTANHVLSLDKRVNDLVVKPHDLSHYDVLNSAQEEA